MIPVTRQLTMDDLGADCTARPKLTTGESKMKLRTAAFTVAAIAVSLLLTQTLFSPHKLDIVPKAYAVSVFQFPLPSVFSVAPWSKDFYYRRSPDLYWTKTLSASLR